VVLEALKGVKTLAQLSSEFGIHAQQITDWKRQTLEGIPSIFESGSTKPTLTVEQREQRGGPCHRIASFSADRPTEGRERLAEKKITDELTIDPRKLVDPTDQQFSINQQCGVLCLSRSSYYYQPVGESAQNLALMERMDRLFTARPEMGVRRMHQELTTSNAPVNIKKIRRLMRLMGLEAVGPKPRLSKPQPGHTIYPYLLKGVAIERPNQVWNIFTLELMKTVWACIRG